MALLLFAIVGGPAGPLSLDLLPSKNVKGDTRAELIAPFLRFLCAKGSEFKKLAA